MIFNDGNGIVSLTGYELLRRESVRSPVTRNVRCEFDLFLESDILELCLLLLTCVKLRLRGEVTFSV